MSWTYGCPHCNAVLNPDETITLVAHCGALRFLIGFHPQPGNYTIYLPSGIDLDRGSVFVFLCPICQTNMTAGGNNNLSTLDVWQGHIRRKILFSNIAGEHATYVVKDSGVEAKHGPDASQYNGKIKT